MIFIAGNIPMKTGILLLIVSKLEEFDYAGATAVANRAASISLVVDCARAEFDSGGKTKIPSGWKYEHCARV